MRLVQTNLREIDVTTDPARLVESLREFSANVVLLSVGGIVANYPTDLPFHYQNPLLRNDFLGEVIRRTHDAGIRLIARFDFSKVNETIAAQHPEWHYKSVAGESVTYNGQTHICLNSEYQQQLSLMIMREVAERYPIDGVFINMHGYQVTDYSGVYHGTCQCANCRQRFGRPLPVADGGPLAQQYSEFKARTIGELFARRGAAVKAIRPEIATCNYTPEGTDIFRLESGTQLASGVPDFAYSASRNVKLVRSSWPGMAVSNAAVHFIDFPMRYVGVSPYLTAQRVAQDVVHGGWLDYYVMGMLDQQDDRRCFDAVRDIFAFHAAHEDFYTGNVAVADVCLVQPGTTGRPIATPEHLGLYRILAENHVQFDVLREDVLDAERLARYQAVIVPDSQLAVPRVRRLLRTGAQSHERIVGAYFAVRPEDKKVLSGFHDLDMLYLYGGFTPVEAGAQADAFLRYVPPHMFGPPEKCYVTNTSDLPGLIRSEADGQKAVTIPWDVGSHYEEYSHEGHARLVMAALRDLLGYLPSLTVDAPPFVEVAAHYNKTKRRHLVHFINLGGQLGTAYHQPPPLHDLKVTFDTPRAPRRAYALRAAIDVPFTADEAKITVTLPRLSLFETVVVEY